MKMKKTIFANRLFYILLISFIITLFVYNGFVVIKSSNIYGLIPMVIEIGLLMLIFTKSGTHAVRSLNGTLFEVCNFERLCLQFLTALRNVRE